MIVICVLGTSTGMPITMSATSFHSSLIQKRVSERERERESVCVCERKRERGREHILFAYSLFF